MMLLSTIQTDGWMDRQMDGHTHDDNTRWPRGNKTR